METVAVVSEAERAIRALSAHPAPLLAPLARLLLRTESIASSKVEGLQVGARALARAEARRAAGVRVGAEALEILGNIDAMQHAVDTAAMAPRLGVEHLLAIHARLMAAVPHGAPTAGVLRTTQNWIGGNDYTPCGADYVPPPPDQLPVLLDDLCAAMNDDAWPPLVQAALVHAQFETIHPFDDGNGRTGRALIHVLLRRRGVAPQCVSPLSVVLARGRERYLRGLTRFRDGAAGVEGWVREFAECAASAAVLASGYVRAVERLASGWRDRLRALPEVPRADAAAWRLLDALPAHPVLSAATAVQATGRGTVAVYAAIRQLVDAGVLHPLGTGRRHQAWEVDGLLALLARLEAGEGEPGE